MFGATSQATAWDEPPNADHAPTLAPAPEGLSARRVERWLDLPPGAWQGRRLYALRLKGMAFASLGLRQGDLVVVEPGGREQPGRLVVTRGPQGPSLRRVPLPAPIERRMPTVLELPLREKGLSHGERVVGTVIGHLRATGTGALRPVPLSLPTARTKRTTPKTGAGERAAPTATAAEPFSLDHLMATQKQWRDWLAVARDPSSRRSTPAEVERRERLDASLATLCDCLVRTHSPALRAALAAEAGAVVAAIRNEMRG
jgi:hypothetical protein